MRIPDIQALGVVAFTVLGAWCLLSAATQLAFLLPLLSDRSDPFPLAQWSPLAVYALAGTLLLVFRASLSRALFQPTTDSDIEESAVRELQGFLVALLGVWVLVGAFEQGAHVEATLNANFSALSQHGLRGDRLSSLASPDAWAQRLPYLVRLVAGLILFFGSGSIVSVWQASRRAGRSR